MGEKYHTLVPSGQLYYSNMFDVLKMKREKVSEMQCGAKVL
jgi:hypothetical protein